VGHFHGHGGWWRRVRCPKPAVSAGAEAAYIRADPPSTLWRYLPPVGTDVGGQGAVDRPDCTEGRSPHHCGRSLGGPYSMSPSDSMT
jgi:hypothetical protein